MSNQVIHFCPPHDLWGPPGVELALLGPSPPPGPRVHSGTCFVLLGLSCSSCFPCSWRCGRPGGLSPRPCAPRQARRGAEVSWGCAVGLQTEIRTLQPQLGATATAICLSCQIPVTGICWAGKLTYGLSGGSEQLLRAVEEREGAGEGAGFSGELGSPCSRRLGVEFILEDREGRSQSGAWQGR